MTQSGPGDRATSLPASYEPPAPSIDGERLIAVFSDVVQLIGQALPSSSEVVLHDLSRLPNSIVAVHGDVTGRRVGDPATDLLLEEAMTGFETQHLGYETVLPDGRRLSSSTMIIRDVAGAPVAALCINTDVSSWVAVRRIAESMLGSAVPSGPAEPAGPGPVESPEVFVRDVDELAAHLIHQSIADAALPVEQMKKEHKIEVVRRLKARGMFLLRDAVEMIAESLQVSRFTIYNYLNELGDTEPTPRRTAPTARPTAARGTVKHDSQRA
jgi:predicted transcriptional regulator YheO